MFKKMTDREPTHRLDVRVERWTSAEYQEPGLVSPAISETKHYRGRPEDCDLAALDAGAPLLAWDNPESTDFPFHDKTYHHFPVEGGLVEVWCRGRSLRGDVSPWVKSLPLATDVFSAEREEASKHE